MHVMACVLLSQASQLERLREQLQQELTAARSQLQELGAAQDGLRAQVCGCQIVKCVFVSHAVLVRALGTSWDRGVRRISLVRLCLGPPAVGLA